MEEALRSLLKRIDRIQEELGGIKNISFERDLRDMINGKVEVISGDEFIKMLSEKDDAEL